MKSKISSSSVLHPETPVVHKNPMYINDLEFSKEHQQNIILEEQDSVNFQNQQISELLNNN